MLMRGHWRGPRWLCDINKSFQFLPTNTYGFCKRVTGLQ
jgi:hypothetical protein